MRCVYIDNEGRMVVYCYNEDKWRQHATDALIVKEVKDHSQVRDEMCVDQMTATSRSRRNALSNLSRRRLSSMSSGQSSSDFQHCVICLEAYVVGEEVSWSKILLECNHAYHPACIKEWLMRNSGCPCCRSSFIHPNDLKVHFCFGAKSAKAKWIERKNQIIERRTQGEFCVEHGLVFPSEESAECSDEEAGGEQVDNSTHGGVRTEASESQCPTNCVDIEENSDVVPINIRPSKMIQDDQCSIIIKDDEKRSDEVR